MYKRYQEESLKVASRKVPSSALQKNGYLLIERAFLVDERALSSWSVRFLLLFFKKSWVSN